MKRDNIPEIVIETADVKKQEKRFEAYAKELREKKEEAK